MAEIRDTREAGTRYRLLMTYALLAGLLWAVGRLRAPDDPKRVVVTQAQIEARLAAEDVLRGAALASPSESRRQAVRTLAEEAVLAQEAERRRLDRDDALIRSALLGGIHFELAGEVERPTDAETRAFWAAHSGRYAVRPGIVLEQIAFARGKTPPPSEQVLTTLRAGETPEAAGPVAGITSRVQKATRADLVRGYGRAFADAVLAIEDDAWHGPLESTLATHYVRITARTPSAPRDFEAVKAYAAEDLVRERASAAVAEQLDALRTRYEVQIVESRR